MDLVKIAQVCAAECVRQQADTLEDVRNMLFAYQYMLNFRDSGNVFTPGVLEFLGSFVEPMKNSNGFRRTPVTFRNGGSSANPESIDRLMTNLAGLIRNHTKFPMPALSVEILTKDFLWIHPFADGNGRVGFLLQNYLEGTLDNPNPLRQHF